MDAQLASKRRRRRTQADAGTRSVAIARPAKIRIVHLLEPEIIETDPVNFRQLVQSLTGKPPGDALKKEPSYPLFAVTAAKRGTPQLTPSPASVKVEADLDAEGAWRGESSSSSSSGMFVELPEFDGFIDSLIIPPPSDAARSGSDSDLGSCLYDDLFGDSPFSD